MIFKPFKFKKLEIHIWTVLLFVLSYFFDFLEILVISYIITAIHETAHILTAKRCKIKTEAVEILPFGITMRIAGSNIADTSDEIKIASAGPLSNFLIAYFTYGFYNGDFKLYIITASIAMGIFNLLPALPLDGGRIMRAILVRKLGHIRGTSLAFSVTGIFAVLTVLCGIWIIYITGFNFSFLLIGGFLIANLTEERKKADAVIMKDILFSRKKLAEKGSVNAGVLVADVNERARSILEKLSYDRYYLINVVDSHTHPVAVVTETEVIEKMAVYGMNITFKKIVEI